MTADGRWPVGGSAVRSKVSNGFGFIQVFVRVLKRSALVAIGEGQTDADAQLWFAPGCRHGSRDALGDAAGCPQAYAGEQRGELVAAEAC